MTALTAAATELKKHIRILFVLIKNCMMAQLEFRSNFISGLLVESGYTVVTTLYAFVVYQSGVRTLELPQESILVFVGTYALLNGIYVCFFLMNFIQLPQYIRMGTLDLLVTKPVSLQFIATLRYVDIGKFIPNLIAGSVLVGWGWTHSGFDADFLTIAGYLLFLSIAVILTYCVMLLPMLLSFWFVNAHAIPELTHSIWDFNCMPMTIFHPWIQRIGLFVVPVFVITNFSPLYAAGELDRHLMLWAACAAVLFPLLTRLVWKQALKRYVSSGG